MQYCRKKFYNKIEYTLLKLQKVSVTDGTEFVAGVHPGQI